MDRWISHCLKNLCRIRHSASFVQGAPATHCLGAGKHQAGDSRCAWGCVSQGALGMCIHCTLVGCDPPTLTEKGTEATHWPCLLYLAGESRPEGGGRGIDLAEGAQGTLLGCGGQHEQAVGATEPVPGGRVSSSGRGRLLTALLPAELPGGLGASKLFSLWTFAQVLPFLKYLSFLNSFYFSRLSTTGCQLCEEAISDHIPDRCCVSPSPLNFPVPRCPSASSSGQGWVFFHSVSLRQSVAQGLA